MRFSEKLHPFIDLQGRFIDYKADGVDDDGVLLDIDEQFYFFNPKAGLVYQADATRQWYASYSIANREPVRSDFVNAPSGVPPTSETLYNLEAGYRMQTKKLSLNGNLYWMNYKDQLIHTGKINDVGSPIRTNVARSYRAGIEVEGAVELNDRFTLSANGTFSRNKIKDFTEVMYDYGIEWDDFLLVEKRYRDTDIAFSPSVISALGLTYEVASGFEITALSKYVSRQYLDNTSNRDRSLDPYFTTDLRISYSLHPNFAKEITVSLFAANIFNEQYESNGYTWGYLGGGSEFRENYYFPQAGRNYLAMLALRF